MAVDRESDRSQEPGAHAGAVDIFLPGWQVHMTVDSFANTSRQLTYGVVS